MCHSTKRLSRQPFGLLEVN